MQHAKDTFYVTLRNALSVVNADRTVVIRGAVRPAIVVEENELEQVQTPLLDTFILRWIDTSFDTTEPMGLHASTCAVAFTTNGTPEFSGMDRGRVLETLGTELRAMLKVAIAAKLNFGGASAVTTGTNVFWSEPDFGGVVETDERLARTVTVRVFALGEAGVA